MVDNTTQLMNKQFGIGLNSQDIYNIYIYIYILHILKVLKPIIIS